MIHAKVMCRRIGGYVDGALTLAFGQEVTRDFDEAHLERIEAHDGMQVERLAAVPQTKPAPRRRTKKADEPAE